MTGAALSDDSHSSDSGPPLPPTRDSPHSLVLPTGDGWDGPVLHNWAEEIIAHLTSGKSSDRQDGAVLLSSSLSCQRLRRPLINVLKRADSPSAPVLMHLLTQIMHALVPLILDEDADVSRSAIEATGFVALPSSLLSFAFGSLPVCLSVWPTSCPRSLLVLLSFLFLFLCLPLLPLFPTAFHTRAFLLLSCSALSLLFPSSLTLTHPHFLSHLAFCVACIVE